MKKFLLLACAIILACATLTLTGCGGGGGSDSGPSQALGDLIDANTPDEPIIDTDGNEVTTPEVVSAIQLSASSSAIGTGESTTITVTLFNASGQLISDTKVVTFSLDAPELGSISSPVTTSSGVSTETFVARSIEGSVKITASVDSATADTTVQISDTVSANSVTLTSNPASITIGGTTVVNATVVDSNGDPMPDGTAVNFSVDNTALGTIVSSSTISGGNGVAQATFSAGSSTAGTATITGTSGSVSGTVDIDVLGTSAGSIEFLSATPQIVSIQGAGGQETSELKFLVKDSNGNAIIGSKTVRLDLSGPKGGEYLGSTTGTTSIDVGTVAGVATIILNSGTIPGTATITATVLDDDDNPTSLSTSSGVIAIGGGVPSAGHFSLSAEVLNIEGRAFDNITDDITTLLADRYGNKNVLQGTTVSYYSECGAIDRAVALDDIGQGSVTFRTQSPLPQDVDPDALGTAFGSGSCGEMCDFENAFISSFFNIFDEDITSDPNGNNPRDGLCTIVAVVDGEEEFTDKDASGAYEMGEKFTDTYDDIHIDMDDDENDVETVIPGENPHDPDFEDLVVDRDENLVFDGLNGIWDSNKRISKRINLLYTGVPDLTLSTFNINVPHGGSQTIYFALHDSNYNRPIGGTTLGVSISGSGTLSGSTQIEYLDSNALGTPIYAVTISDSDLENEEAKAVDLKFSWTWKGGTFALSIPGTTN